VTGARITQTGPGTGLKVSQSGPGVGMRISAGVGTESALTDLEGFIGKGRAMQDKFLADDDAAAIKANEIAWAAEVSGYLRNHVGVAEAIQFDTTDANPMDGQPSGHSETGGFYWAKILAKNRLLAQIMVQQEQRSR
jgi:hypothetical protein